VNSTTKSCWRRGNIGKRQKRIDEIKKANKNHFSNLPACILLNSTSLFVGL
jgi:hypothetical protein